MQEFRVVAYDAIASTGSPGHGRDGEGSTTAAPGRQRTPCVYPMYTLQGWLVCHDMNIGASLGDGLPHSLLCWRLVIRLFIVMKGKRLPLVEPWSLDKITEQYYID